MGNESSSSWDDDGEATMQPDADTSNPDASHLQDMALAIESWRRLHATVTKILGDESLLASECARIAEQPGARTTHDEEERAGVVASGHGAMPEGARIFPDDLRRATQTLIDQLGCRHPATLAKVTAVFAGFAGRRDGLTDTEFRGYIACILTQLQRELESRCAAAGVRLTSCEVQVAGQVGLGPSPARKVAHGPDQGTDSPAHHSKEVGAVRQTARLRAASAKYPGHESRCEEAVKDPRPGGASGNSNQGTSAAQVDVHKLSHSVVHAEPEPVLSELQLLTRELDGLNKTLASRSAEFAGSVKMDKCELLNDQAVAPLILTTTTCHKKQEEEYHDDQNRTMPASYEEAETLHHMSELQRITEELNGLNSRLNQEPQQGLHCEDAGLVAASSTKFVAAPFAETQRITEELNGLNSRLKQESQQGQHCEDAGLVAASSTKLVAAPFAETEAIFTGGGLQALAASSSASTDSKERNCLPEATPTFVPPVVRTEAPLQSNIQGGNCLPSSYNNSEHGLRAERLLAFDQGGDSSVPVDPGNSYAKSFLGGKVLPQHRQQSGAVAAQRPEENYRERSAEAASQAAVKGANAQLPLRSVTSDAHQPCRTVVQGEVASSKDVSSTANGLGAATTLDAVAEDSASKPEKASLSNSLASGWQTFADTMDNLFLPEDSNSKPESRDACQGNSPEETAPHHMPLQPTAVLTSSSGCDTLEHGTRRVAPNPVEAPADVPLLFRVPSVQETVELLELEGLPAYVALGASRGFVPKRLCLDASGPSLYILEADSAVPSVFFGLSGFHLQDLRRMAHGPLKTPEARPLLSLEFNDGFLPVRLGNVAVLRALVNALSSLGQVEVLEREEWG